MLLDFFHDPKPTVLPWTSIHDMFAASIARQLNQTLPEGWVAGPGAMYRQESDAVVADVRDPAGTRGVPSGDGASGSPGDRDEIATLPRQVARTIPFVPAEDTVEVRVLGPGGRLAGLIELVSPSNLRRADLAAFCGKVEAALVDRVGVCVVDIVTNSPHSLHYALLTRLGEDEPESHPLYVAAYATRWDGVRIDSAELDIWYQPLEIGQPMTDSTLSLKDGPTVILPLRSAYEEVLQDLRIDAS